MLLEVATSLAALLAVFIYRNGNVAWNHILTVPDLPDAYYIGGNWTSHCSLIQDPASTDLSYCEDITFWDHWHGSDDPQLANRLVLLGCDPNRKAWNTVMGPLRDPGPRGHLFLYDPSTDEVQRLALAGYPDGHDFHPLGMAVTPSLDGAPSNLFVINHARAHTTVEQFVLRPARAVEEEEQAGRASHAMSARQASAQYVRSLRSPYFVSLNAIALTGPTSFFVSNDHLLTRRLPYPIGRVLPPVESTAALPLGWLAHVSLREPASSSSGVEVGVEHTFAALGIPFANGIALSPSGTQLAVSACSLALVYFYDVNKSATGSTPTLSFSHSVPVPFFPDNVAYDDDGSLIVAGHPHFPSLIRVAANATGARSPSWAVSISPFSNEGNEDSARGYDRRAPLSASKFVPMVSTNEVETLFQSDGSVFGSSSTTLRDSRTGAIYVAGLYEQGILTCRP